MMHNQSEGPPCRHMEHMLHDAADGTGRGLKLWYALHHSARCGRCGRFLARLRETLAAMTQVKETPADDAMARLRAGRWREEVAAEE